MLRKKKDDGPDTPRAGVSAQIVARSLSTGKRSLSSYLMAMLVSNLTFLLTGLIMVGGIAFPV